MKLFNSKYVIKLITILLIFLFDRLTKIKVLNLFENNQLEEIYISNFLNIYLIWNKGIAFGLLNFDDRLVYNLITVVIAVVSLIILFLALRIKDYKSYFFTVIFGGAIGNFYDRISFRAVPDFIDFHINNYHWFIFNVADIFVTLGVICLILDELFVKKKVNEKN
jgi:signal peptidase II